MAHSQLLRDVVPRGLILRVTNTTVPTWKNPVQNNKGNLYLRHKF